MAKKKVEPVKKAAAKKTSGKKISVKTKPARPKGGKAASKKVAVKKIVKKAAKPARPAGGKAVTKTITKAKAKKVAVKKIVANPARPIAGKAITPKAESKTIKPIVKPIVKSTDKPVVTPEPKKIKGPTELLADAIVEGILEVKGRNISVLNLKDVHNRVCDYFIICQADSNTQVNAIAGSVEVMVKKITGERPYRKEGFENSEWILVDYVTVVVHVFQTEVRNFYNLESLWADAEVTQIAFDK